MAKQNVNVFERVHKTYLDIMQEKDAGKKLLKLDVLKKDLQKIIKKPKAERPDMPKWFLTIPTGSVVGVGLTVAAIGTGVPDAFLLSSVTGLTGALMGAVGSLLYGFEAGNRIKDKQQSKMDMEYMGQVLPYLPQLQVLQKRVKQEIKNMVSPDHSAAVLQSPVLKQVLQLYPNLVQDFKKAQMKKPAPDLSQIENEPRPPKKGLEL